jgi:cephalosporin-C deacetylase-like acetyl esterase
MINLLKKIKKNPKKVLHKLQLYDLINVADRYDNKVLEIEWSY